MKKIVIGSMLVLIMGDLQASTIVEPGLTRQELLHVATGLVVVILFIVVLAYILRKLQWFQRANNADIRVVSSTALGARERIAIIRAGERHLLVGITPTAISLLCDFGDSPPEGLVNNKAGKTDFARILNKSMKKRD